MLEASLAADPVLRWAPPWEVHSPGAKDWDASAFLLKQDAIPGFQDAAGSMAGSGIRTHMSNVKGGGGNWGTLRIPFGKMGEP